MANLLNWAERGSTVAVEKIGDGANASYRVTNGIGYMGVGASEEAARADLARNCEAQASADRAQASALAREGWLVVPPPQFALRVPPRAGSYLLQYFAFDHLPPHLQDVSRPFHAVAHRLVRTLPDNEERAVMLRKLLEAKDCAVRSAMLA